MFTPIQRAQIRVESGCDETTIKKYPRVSDASKRRIERAAATIGIPLDVCPRESTTACTAVSPDTSNPPSAA